MNQGGWTQEDLRFDTRMLFLFGGMSLFLYAGMCAGSVWVIEHWSRIVNFAAR